MEYQLYSRYKSKISCAQGEFPYRFSLAEQPNVEEYIMGTSMISKERTPDGICWYKGQYIAPATIKEAFSLSEIPDKEGVGMLQPFLGKFSSESLKAVVIILAIFITLAQFYFDAVAKEELAFKQSYFITDSLNKKEIYSQVFELKHGLANVEIKVATNIINNWMYTAITLVNEATGDLYNLDLEAEYYTGVDGGESWSEGESWVSKVISQVPEGKYFMIIYPDKPTSMSSVNLDISVTRDVFILSNGLIAIAVLGIFPAFYFYRKERFEKKRWYNSNYSPYDDEDY